MAANLKELLSNRQYEYIVTIDGGGTKTKIEVLDKDGHPMEINHDGKWVTSLVTDSSNISTHGVEKVKKLLHDAFQSSTLKNVNRTLADIMPTSLILAGMAGTGNDKSRKDAQSIFTDLGVLSENVDIATDAETGLIYAGEEGIAVISGTGSICQSRPHYRAGGNGAAMFNDPGSAFYLSTLALEYLFDSDQSGSQAIPKSEFYHAIRMHVVKDVLNDETRKLIIDENTSTAVLKAPFNQHQFSTADVATIAPIVFEYAYARKDKNALAMIKKTAKAIADNIVKILLAKQPNKDIDAVLIGGMFSFPYAEEFINLINVEVNESLQKEQYQPTLNYINTSHFNLISENVKTQLELLRKEKIVKEAEVENRSLAGKSNHYQFPIERLKGEKNSTLMGAAQSLDSHLRTILTTEKSHPKTMHMAEQAQNDEMLKAAAQTCAEIDMEALKELQNKYLNEDEKTLFTHIKFKELINDIKTTIDKNGRIFLAGCGSSGRLALFLEKFCNEHLPEKYRNKIVAVLAGGDFALVSPIEKFEDNPEYAARQLKKQGFNPKQDLYIGISASGGATFNNAYIRELAENIKQGNIESHLKPWLICCNSAERLKEVKEEEYRLERGNNRPAHPLVDYVDDNAEYMKCLGIDVGPNALSGSTRMQSATVSEIAAYMAIVKAFDQYDNNYIKDQMELLINKLQQNKFAENIASLVKAEAHSYAEGRYLMYQCAAELAIKVFTDLTERSPTFKLPTIENENFSQGKKFAPASLSILNATKENAFSKMLGRDAMGLDWEEQPKTMTSALAGFDFGSNNLQSRQQKTDKPHDMMDISFSNDNKQLIFSFGTAEQHAAMDKNSLQRITFDVEGLDDFSRQMFLKMVLNTHSTLVMGRMKRYKGNAMTFVSVGNEKLFGRAVRLISEEVSCRLKVMNLDIFKRQIDIPGVGLTHSAQAIAIIVTTLVMSEQTKSEHDKQKKVLLEEDSNSIFDTKQIASIVEKAIEIYLEKMQLIDEDSINRVQDMQHCVDETKRKLEQSERDFHHSAEKIADIQAQVEKSNQKIADMQKIIISTQNEILQLQSLISKILTSAVINLKISDTQDKIDTLQKSIKELREIIAATEKNIDEESEHSSALLQELSCDLNNINEYKAAFSKDRNSLLSDFFRVRCQSGVDVINKVIEEHTIACSA